MDSLPDEENPFAPPEFPTVSQQPDELLKSAARILRGMGWTGLILYLVMPPPIFMDLSKVKINPMTAVMAAAIFIFVVTLFLLMIHTANFLAADFRTFYRRARWLAIIAAAIWFPWMTVPAVIVIRKLERYRSSVNSGHVEQDLR